MNKAALTRREIYKNLAGFSEKDLSSIANFVDFMRHQKKTKTKKILKLKGVLKSYDIDLSSLKQFKTQSWKHVDEEFADE